MHETDVNTEFSKEQTAVPFGLANPEYKHMSRPSYELGMLLLELPDRASAIKPSNAKSIARKAQAASSHVKNATYTVQHGLEALGSFIWVASANETNEVDPDAVGSIGELIKHLAVELQFYTDVQCRLDSLMAGDDQ